VSHQHLPNEEIVARLRDTPLFGGLDNAALLRLADLGEIVDLEPGELLIREGDLADALYVVLDGEMEVTKRSGTAEIPVALVGPGSLQGEIAALEGGRRLASVRAVGRAEVVRIPIETMRELLAAGPDLALGIIGTAVARLRGMESLLREREKLAGLGTLAAGLAHELNNPAAAALRSVRSLEEAVSRAGALPHPTPPPEPPSDTAPPRSALDRADRIGQLAELVAGTRRPARWSRPAGRPRPLPRPRPSRSHGLRRTHRSGSCWAS
jgi:CRP-like cAMP-binding protein